jgi:RNA polymerase sigma factor (sigma-70 family)
VETNLPKEGCVDPNKFATTRWSIVLACSNREEQGDAHRALSELCQTYWRPVFIYVCRRGYSVPDAQDLAQDFFMKLLEGNLLKLADPNRGRFRSLLCTALRNFLADKQDQIGREKRGGRIHFIMWDEWMAEAPSQVSVCSERISAWSPEQIFDLRWAATVVEQALRRLSEECAQHGRLRAFTVLSKCLTSEREDISYSVLATTLGVSDSSIKRLLHDMRCRFRAILREEVAETVDAEASIEDEIRYLCATLAAGAT